MLLKSMKESARARGPESERRSRLAVDQRRSHLLAIGLALFSSQSYDELSVDDIARAAGVSKGLLYHYFDGKRGFYVETVRHSADELYQTVLEAAEREPDPLAQLRAGLTAYLGYVDEHAHAYVALLRGGVGFDPEVAGIVEQTRRYFLDRLLRDFEQAPDRPRLRNAFRGFIGFVEAASLDWVDQRDVSKEHLVELSLAMAERTIDALLAT
jgi:AcrR family transcriptional regulator